MPRFPLLEQLTLPATFSHYVPGNLHPDGHRYLPLLLWKLANGLEIGIVDRHHIIDPSCVGEQGEIGIVFLLSTITLQPPDMQRQGLEPERRSAGRVSTAPAAYGRVLHVPSWEEERGNLSYEYLYTELLLDIGLGIVGVRTAMTATDLQSTLGKERLEAGDWITVGQSRIDILQFSPRVQRLPQGGAHEHA
ncbi:MAG: hypothetical protein H0X37_23115 [Herpetosiphonaceae bacterium]|nr:hypothetical protein [Herpetosiphonaceae bacterium]